MKEFKITQVRIDQVLETMFDMFGLDEPDVCENYSGRGMRGAECLGFVVAPSDVFAVGAACGEVLRRSGNVEDVQLLHALVTRARTDNMGLQTIVYFPGVTLEKE